MTKEEWNKVTKYDLKPGTLFRLNEKLYKEMKRDDLSKLLCRINKEHFPDVTGTRKLGLKKLAKILSGSEYNTHIVHAIMRDLTFSEKSVNP